MVNNFLKIKFFIQKNLSCLHYLSTTIYLTFQNVRWSILLEKNSQKSPLYLSGHSSRAPLSDILLAVRFLSSELIELIFFCAKLAAFPSGLLPILLGSWIDRSPVGRPAGLLENCLLAGYMRQCYLPAGYITRWIVWWLGISSCMSKQ